VKEFEVLGADGQIYLHNDNWYRWRQARLDEYPCPVGHWRFDLELSHPRNSLVEVPVERNPHTHGGGWNAHSWFYTCDQWSTIFGVHDAHLPVEGENYRMLVESGCSEPLWGERIRLYSTGHCIVEEPWGTNVPNKFAFFRNQFWRVSKWEFLHPYPDPRPYPLSCTWEQAGLGTDPYNYAQIVMRSNRIYTRFGRQLLGYSDIDWCRDGF